MAGLVYTVVRRTYSYCYPDRDRNYTEVLVGIYSNPDSAKKFVREQPPCAHKHDDAHWHKFVVKEEMLQD